MRRPWSAAATLPAELEYLRWLIVECGYFSPRIVKGGLWAAIQPKIFTHSIAVGRIGDYCGVDTFWCYHTRAQALAALDAWQACGFYGEPTGWHRHPASGRRVALEDGELDRDGQRVAAGEVYQRA